MPGFDRTGPIGMGPMTGGGRGLCNPSAFYDKHYFSGDSGSWFGRGRGRGRGYRQWYRATGLLGWMRFGPVGPWGYPPVSPYTTEQEKEVLKDQAAALKAEVGAIESRLRDLESEGQRAE